MKTLATALVTLVGATAIIAPVPASAAKPTVASLQRKISKMKSERRALARKYVDALADRDYQKSQASAFLRQVNALTAKVSSLSNENTTLSGQLTQAQADLTAANSRATTAEQARDAAVQENGMLKGDVPSKVAAIAAEGNSSQLQNLVLVPARNAWACGGSVFYGSTFFSFDFNRPGYCD